jgi:hypothetical protein
MMNTDPSDSASMSAWWNATSNGIPLVQFYLYDYLLDGRGATGQAAEKRLNTLAVRTGLDLEKVPDDRKVPLIVAEVIV